jgi:hypothetical protein
MPDRNYTVVFDLCTNSIASPTSSCRSGTVTLVFIDTVSLVPDDDPIVDAAFPTNPNVRVQLTSQHLQWLESELRIAANRATTAWIFVVGHHPVYANVSVRVLSFSIEFGWLI